MLVIFSFQVDSDPELWFFELSLFYSPSKLESQGFTTQLFFVLSYVEIMSSSSRIQKDQLHWFIEMSVKKRTWDFFSDQTLLCFWFGRESIHKQDRYFSPSSRKGDSLTQKKRRESARTDWRFTKCQIQERRWVGGFIKDQRYSRFSYSDSVNLNEEKETVRLLFQKELSSYGLAQQGYIKWSANILHSSSW